MRALLDVNVLIALLDQDHLDHARVRRWLTAEIRHGWSSCALTQNGVVRIMSQPGYPNPLTPAEVIDRLGRAVRTEHHEYWSSSVSVLDPTLVDRSAILGPRQVTDVYLLALATKRGGRFVTLDRTVPRAAVPAARPEHLLVIGQVPES